jgi:uncharacterized damage-inducible protein DinB
MKKISKPHFSEYAMYYESYLNLIDEHQSVLDQMKQSTKSLIVLYKSLPEPILRSTYAPSKWSMKDMLMHLIDVERVFIYRAMRFARQDKTPLPFFDENAFAQHAAADRIPTTKLLKEYNANRNLTLAFFNNLNTQQLKSTGIASNFTMSTRACAWIILGHELHHKRIIEERYLPSHTIQ